jgi:hypothetical protein
MDTKKYLLNVEDGKFSLIKEGNKRATRVFDNRDELNQYIKNNDIVLISDPNQLKFEYFEDKCSWIEEIDIVDDGDNPPIHPDTNMFHMQSTEIIAATRNINKNDPDSFEKTGPNFWQKIVSLFKR